MAIRKSTFADATADTTTPLRTGALLLFGLAILGLNLVLLNKASFPVKKANTQAVTERTSIGTEGEIRSGSAEAPVVVDFYYDYHCESCMQVDGALGSILRDEQRIGRVLVNYHPLVVNDSHTRGEKYASRAAGAAYCVAQESPEAFENYHRRLLSMQPQIGSFGHNNKWLADEGARAGAKPQLLDCITRDTYEPFAREMTAKFRQTRDNHRVPQLYVNERPIPLTISQRQLRQRLKLESVGWEPTINPPPAEVELPTIDPSDDVKLPWMEQPKSLGRQIGEL